MKLLAASEGFVIVSASMNESTGLVSQICDNTTYPKNHRSEKINLMFSGDTKNAKDFFEFGLGEADQKGSILFEKNDSHT